VRVSSTAPDRPRAHINGVVAAERVVVDGNVEGPIQGGEVILKSQALVVGDIHHQSLAIERVLQLLGVLFSTVQGGGKRRILLWKQRHAAFVA
jgi:cytoskeletal protein CcmA (bactofilin family)